MPLKRVCSTALCFCEAGVGCHQYPPPVCTLPSPPPCVRMLPSPLPCALHPPLSPSLCAAPSPLHLPVCCTLPSLPPCVLHPPLSTSLCAAPSPLYLPVCCTLPSLPPCALYSQSDHSWRKCPICFESVHRDSLKRYVRCQRAPALLLSLLSHTYMLVVC